MLARKLLVFLHALLAAGRGEGCHRTSPAAPPDLAPTKSLQSIVTDPRTRELEEWVKADPSSVARRRELARHYSESDNLAGAEEQLAAAVGLEPDSQAVQMELASIQFRLRKLGQAEQAYRKLTTLNPRSAEAWEGLSGSLFFQQRYFESVHAARRAVKFSPKEPRYRAALAAALMEHACQFPGVEASYLAELREARREFEKLTRLWPEKGEIYYRLGRVCLELGDYQSASEALFRAREMLPSRSDIALLLAKAVTRLGRRADALDLVQNMIVHAPDAALYHFKGQLLSSSSSEHQKDAIESFDRASQMAPNSAAVREAYGSALLRAGRLDEARIELMAATELEPFRPYPLQQLATLYTRMGRNRQAAELGRQASMAVKDEQLLRNLEARAESAIRNPEMHLVLADRYRKIGKSQAARDEYLMVLQSDPKNRRARMGLDLLRRPPGNSTLTSISTRPDQKSISEIRVGNPAHK